jgi:4-amino-4-deoxy-L-arabinose transferase-like glycosyltransferase
VFSAAFPFFNNVDEQMHFDLVVKYARGYLPEKNFPYYFDRESIKYIARYGTPEYLAPFKMPEDYKITPEIEAKNTDILLDAANHELYSPPLYYIIAGAWYNLGKYIGIQGGHLLYWIRFLNIPIYSLLMIFSYFLCRLTFPNDVKMKYGVMLLLAFIPQDVFYSINNDVLSALFSTISLYLLFRLLKDNNKIWLYLLAGLITAATILVKLSNIPMIIIFSIIYLCIIIKFVTTNIIKDKIIHLVVLALSLLTPITIWCVFNYLTLGDIAGTSAHISYCGWTIKPFNQLLNHPIFTFKGFYYFISNLTTSFWRGEFVWHLERIKSVAADNLYLITSVIFSVLGMWCMLFPKDSNFSKQRLYDYILISTPLCFIAFLAYLSIRYDFNNDYYPSREFPYFVSGRLMLAAFIPYLIIYVKGIEYFIEKTKLKVDPLLILLVIVLISFYSEVTLTYQLGIFANKLNFFNM